jgi:hypothetical protein
VMGDALSVGSSRGASSEAVEPEVDGDGEEGEGADEGAAALVASATGEGVAAGGEEPPQPAVTTATTPRARTGRMSATVHYCPSQSSMRTPTATR